MYEDLARSQRQSPVEWVVLHVIVPSFAVTLLLQPFGANCEFARSPGRLREDISFAVIPVVTPPAPPVAPVLVSIRRPDYPPAMRRTGTAGRVVLKAMVDQRGRVRRSSIAVLQTSDSRFDAAARQALGSAVFWPARSVQPHAAWVTMVVDFSLYRE